MNIWWNHLCLSKILKIGCTCAIANKCPPLPNQDFDGYCGEAQEFDDSFIMKYYYFLVIFYDKNVIFRTSKRNARVLRVFIVPKMSLIQNLVPWGIILRRHCRDSLGQKVYPTVFLVELGHIGVLKIIFIRNFRWISYKKSNPKKLFSKKI